MKSIKENKMKYKKKPVVIEAIQWNGKNTKQVLEFMGQKVDLSNPIAQDRFYDYELSLKNGWKITTLEGGHIASINDFIIKGIKGEFYPCKPDIFELTYEKVEE